jgi:hypothetical protein
VVGNERAWAHDTRLPVSTSPLYMSVSAVTRQRRPSRALHSAWMEIRTARRAVAPPTSCRSLHTLQSCPAAMQSVFRPPHPSSLPIALPPLELHARAR